MNPTIKVSIPCSFYDEVVDYRQLHMSGGPDSIWGRMFIEQYKAEATGNLGKKRNFYMLLTAEDLNDIIDLCEQDLENTWDPDLFPPYRYMLKQAQKKLATLNS